MPTGCPEGKKKKKGLSMWVTSSSDLQLGQAAIQVIQTMFSEALSCVLLTLKPPSLNKWFLMLQQIAPKWSSSCGFATSTTDTASMPNEASLPAQCQP